MRTATLSCVTARIFTPLGFRDSFCVQYHFILLFFCHFIQKILELSHPGQMYPFYLLNMILIYRNRILLSILFSLNFLYLYAMLIKIKNKGACMYRIAIEIKDFSAPELDVYARLNENQLLNRHEPEKGLFIAESPKVVERALNAGYEPVSLLLERKHIDGEAREIVARCSHVPIYTSDFEVLKNLTGFPLTRGVLCAMRRPPLPSMEEICKNARRIAILENVVNPTNVGAIFRSAAALNMDAVLLTPACSDPLYRRASRVSMGTVFQIPWTYLGCEVSSHPFTDMERIKKLGFQTVAMALKEDTLNIDDPRLEKEAKLAIILGTEGDGLDNSTLMQCDYTVKIPMSHGVDSLNVAAASAIAFWQLGKNNSQYK